MKQTEKVQAELAAELTKMKEVADKVTAALAEMASLADSIPGETAAIVARANEWEQEVRAHGTKITVKDDTGRLIDLHADQIFVSIGGEDGGKVFVNFAHTVPGAASFREATTLELNMLKTTWAYFNEACEAVYQVGR